MKSKLLFYTSMDYLELYKCTSNVEQKSMMGPDLPSNSYKSSNVVQKDVSPNAANRPIE